MKLGKEDNLLGNTYNSNNLITKVYFRTKIMTAIKLANLKKEDIILDYGCGGGWLEHKLKNYKIYGLDVFEHIPLEEIKKIIKNFKKMGKFELIVSQPTENFISRKVRKLVGKEEVPKEHITRYKDIVNLLKTDFKLIKKINFFTVCHIFLFS